jgi:DNA-binding transcriptional ArsR family regulator
MSRHLRVLRHAGLIEEVAREGDDARVRVYRLRPEPFIALGRWVAEVEGYWGDQLAAFKTHVDRTRGARTA